MSKKRSSLLLIAFLFVTCVHASPSYWEGESIRAYVHNSELQRRWAMAFLAPHLKDLAGGEDILDIGCGDGKITADISTFTPYGNVIGIDPSPDMIGWALLQYDQREYQNLQFHIGDFIKPNVEGRFDIVMSLCAMHHCPDHRQAFETLHRLLKPEGKLLILVPSAKDSDWDDAVAAACQNPKWAFYWKDYVPRVFLDSSQYRELLINTGFKVVRIEDVPTVDPFIGKQELIDWLKGTYPPLVPKKLADQFFLEIVDDYIRRKPESVTDNNRICVSFDSIRIVAVVK